MMSERKPHFEIKSRFQKGGTYRALLTPAVLADIAKRVTGRADYTVNFDDSEYNVGRLAVLWWRGTKSFISISEDTIRSRNASFQSFPSALSRYILDEAKAKRICYYVHPKVTGNLETDYFRFMYRLMMTADVHFLNLREYVAHPIAPFVSPEDMIAAKEALRARGKGNRSTYLTKGDGGVVQVYGKTYGANKYESTLICIALTRILPSGIELYEVEEGGLTKLPEISQRAIRAAGAVEIATSTRAIEKAEFVERNSLRSIRFVYNLLAKFEYKRCAFCDCEIAEIIQGAHVWPVASIKKASHLSIEEQLDHALSGDNGLWLCENHHKLFDAGLVVVSSSGSLMFKSTLSEDDAHFLRGVTSISQLSKSLLRGEFLAYLAKRNVSLNESHYTRFS